MVLIDRKQDGQISRLPFLIDRKRDGQISRLPFVTETKQEKSYKSFLKKAGGNEGELCYYPVSFKTTYKEVK